MSRPAARSAFARFAAATSHVAGRPAAFSIAVLVVLAWAVTGPLFGFSDTWQLVINTGTTIVTFLMVFLIQSTQNRDTAAVQIKLDELIHAVRGAQDALLDSEELDDEALDRMHARAVALAERARAAGGDVPGPDPALAAPPRRRRGRRERRRTR
jgi:low affinity Fe/Cu permease